MISSFLSGLGASAPAGLNATLPLLILALADRFTSVIELDQPYDLLSSSWAIIALLLLLPIELVADKIARVDHANDLLHSAIRPASGALIFMAIASQDDEINAVIAMLLGLLVAGGVHWFKTTQRPAITVATRGVGNPIVSMIEDAAVIVTTIVAVFVPYAVIAILPLSGWFVYRTYRRLQSGDAQLGGIIPATRRG